MQLSPQLKARLDALADRFEEVSALLADREVVTDRDRFTELSREFAELDPVIGALNDVTRLETEIEETRALTRDSDPELRALATEDVIRLETDIESARERLLTLLLPRDPDDTANIFLEVRAGTGGDEAAIFSGDLFRMYSKFAENNRWKIEVISENQGDHGGYASPHTSRRPRRKKHLRRQRSSCR